MFVELLVLIEPPLDLLDNDEFSSFDFVSFIEFFSEENCDFVAVSLICKLEFLELEVGGFFDNEGGPLNDNSCEETFLTLGSTFDLLILSSSTS